MYFHKLLERNIIYLTVTSSQSHLDEYHNKKIWTTLRKVSSPKLLFDWFARGHRQSSDVWATHHPPTSSPLTEVTRYVYTAQRASVMIRWVSLVIAIFIALNQYICCPIYGKANVCKTHSAQLILYQYITCMYVCMYMCVYICMYVCMYMYVHVCMYMCVYTYVCM